MCNYSQFLVQKGKAEGREEQEKKDMLKFLESLEAFHYSDKRIMQLLRIDAEHLKSLREMLREKRAAVTAV